MTQPQAQQKRPAGRPKKVQTLTSQARQAEQAAKQETLASFDNTPTPVAKSGLIPITEEEYNRLNGIVPEPELKEIMMEEAMAKESSTDYLKSYKDLTIPTKSKVGTFIVVNTPNIQGVRLNLEKVRTYAKAGQNEHTVQVAWDNGTSSAYDFGSVGGAEQFLALLDSYCL